MTQKDLQGPGGGARCYNCVQTKPGSVPASTQMGNVGFTYAPPIQALFETDAVPLRFWPWLLFGGFVFFLIVELEKLILRKVRGVAATAI